MLGYATTDAQTLAYARDELGRIAGVQASAATIAVTRTTEGLGEKFVTVRAQYTFRSLVPWPLLPAQATFDRSTAMREFR